MSLQLWQQFLSQNEKEFGKETVDKWLRSLVVKKSDISSIYLEAPDSFQALWFEEHIRPRLHLFVNQKSKPIKVVLTVQGKPAPAKKRDIGKDGHSQFTLHFDELDPSHSFEEFYISKENEVPIRIIQQICTNLTDKKVQSMSSFSDVPKVTKPKESINPIYLYGPSGTGKSHLLSAICQKLRRVGYEVIYVSSLQFCDHLVKAIKAGQTQEFRKIYRKADVLLIDDVHSFGRKSTTQEEFFHTFNTLHAQGLQIVLASSLAPCYLQHIEPRLISRFEWGIVLDLQLITKKELQKVIETRASFFNFPISMRIVEFLAETFPSSPKQAMKALETLVLRTHMHSSINPTLLSLSSCKTILSDLIKQEKDRSINPQMIIDTVSEHYGISIDDISGKSQDRVCTLARKVSMYLCRQLLKMPYMKIGDIFTRDHSTVMSSIRQVEKLKSTPQSDVANKLHSIETELVRYAAKE